MPERDLGGAHLVRQAVERARRSRAHSEQGVAFAASRSSITSPIGRVLDVAFPAALVARGLDGAVLEVFVARIDVHRDERET